MYLSYYELNSQPFGVTPDPKYLFWSHSHREALASLFYGIESGCGFMTLIAPPGMGKTTLLFHLLERLRSTARTAYIFQTQCSSSEFLRYLMADLGWNASEQDLVALYVKLYDLLIAEARAEKRFVLVIDEAQNLDDSVLETVRLLSNFETPNRKLMQVILAGQPQLSSKLARLELWQLRQRISIMSRLDPLSLPEVTEYVKHRFEVAGYQGASVFTPKALATIASASKGIPRAINNICFNALSLGYAQNCRKINVAIVREVISDLDLEKPAGPAPDPGCEVEPQIADDTPPQPNKPDLPAGPSPVTGWKVNSHRFEIAALVVLMLLAVSVFVSQILRKPAAMREATVQAASPVPLVRAAPSAIERPDLSGLRAWLNDSNSTQFMTITVGRKESLDYITRRYLRKKLNPKFMEEILQLNPIITNPNKIEIGNRIRLPLSELRTNAPSTSLLRGTGHEQEKQPAQNK